MGYLEGKSVYLCGPMAAEADDGKGWRELLTPHLEKMGIEVIDPTKSTANGVGEVGDDKKRFREIIKQENFSQLKKEFWPIIRKDLRAVDKADFLIVNYDATSTTVGTYDECTRASIQKKPILMKYDRNQLDVFNPWVVTWVKDGEFFPSWDKLLMYLSVYIDKGKYNSSHWTL